MTNKYLIISNKSKVSKEIENELNKILNENWLVDKKNPKYIFIIGGDGTFLRNVEKINQFNDPYIIPINGGNFGFYSHFNINNIKFLLKNLIDKKNYYKPIIIKCNFDKKENIAINEFTLIKNKTLMINIMINDILYQKFIGTGIIVSTPTGSTARNKSAGGAVIFPGIDLIQLLEIEPINQKDYNTLMSPIIFDKNTKIKFEILNDDKINKSFAILDGNKIINFKNNWIELNFEKAKFNLYKPYDFNSYIQKLRKAFISGS